MTAWNAFAIRRGTKTIPKLEKELFSFPIYMDHKILTANVKRSVSKQESITIEASHWRGQLLSWPNTKFLWLIYKEMCNSYRGELTIRSWELKG